VNVVQKSKKYRIVFIQFEVLYFITIGDDKTNF
jgi:hypothetical protein